MRKKKGSILIITLWVLIILAILSVIISYRASSDIKLAKYETDSVKATYLARAGIMKTLAELARDTNTYDSLNEDWNRNRENPKKFKIRNDTVFHGASDEGSRLDLNMPALEKGSLVRLGLEDGLAGRLLDYRTRKGDKGFEFMEELFLVEGMTRQTYSSIKDFVTIYKKDMHKTNINTASEEVLRAILGDDIVVQDILEYRRGLDGKEGTEDDGIFRQIGDMSMIGEPALNLFSISSDIFRIWSESFFSGDDEVLKSIEAVVNRRSGKIYYWKEY